MTTKTLSVCAASLLGVFAVFSGTAGADPNRDTKEAVDAVDNQLLKNAQSEAGQKYLAETRGHVAIHLDEARKLQGGVSR